MYLCASGDREIDVTFRGAESADQSHGVIGDMFQFNGDTGVMTARRLILQLLITLVKNWQ